MGVIDRDGFGLDGGERGSSSGRLLVGAPGCKYKCSCIRAEKTWEHDLSVLLRFLHLQNGNGI